MKENIKTIFIKNYKWIILLICIIAFLAILEDVFEYEQLKMDVIVYKMVVENMRLEPLTTILKVMTNLGGAYVLIGISIFSIIVLKNKKISLGIIINLIIITLLNVLLKNIIDRPRPEGYRIITETGYSFPSGHSMVSMAFYGLLIYLIWKNVGNKKIKYISCILLGLLITMIGFSRIYLGVHYASDVLGGFVISIAYLIVFTTITKSVLELDSDNREEVKNEAEKI